jgi:hypothetical protein
MIHRMSRCGQILRIVAGALTLVGARVAMAQESPPEASGGATPLELHLMWGSSWSISTFDDGGKANAPAERVYFGRDHGRQNAVQIAVGTDTMSCPLIAQDVAYPVGKPRKGNSIPVSWYQGCPFAAPDTLKPSADFEMRTTTVLAIVGAVDNVLIPDTTTERPLISMNGEMYTGCEIFRNMVWKFRKAGIRFRSGNVQYKVLRAGGTIRFTSKGVVMDGVAKIASGAAPLDRSQEAFHRWFAGR